MTALQVDQGPWSVERSAENQMLLELRKLQNQELSCIIKTISDFENQDLMLVFSDPVDNVQVNGITLTSKDGLIYSIHDGVHSIQAKYDKGIYQYEILIKVLPDGEQRPFAFLKGSFLLNTEGVWQEKDAHQWRYNGEFLLANNQIQNSTEDFIRNGMPFMAQPVEVVKKVSIQKDAQSVMLQLTDIYADAALVSVDGKELGWIFGPDWSIECGLLQQGDHTVALKLIPNTFNTYGPHHHLDGDRHLTSPMQYEGIKNFADYNHSPEHTLIDAWHFVKFGIGDEIKFMN